MEICEQCGAEFEPRVQLTECELCPECEFIYLNEVDEDM